MMHDKPSDMTSLLQRIDDEAAEFVEATVLHDKLVELIDIIGWIEVGFYFVNPDLRLEFSQAMFIAIKHHKDKCRSRGLEPLHATYAYLQSLVSH